MELQLIKGNTYYLSNAVNIGYCKGIMIDAGIDEGFAKKAVRIIEQDNLKKIEYLMNTHTHPDHCGGNATVLAKSKAKLLATKEQVAFLEQKGLGNFFFYGAKPLNVTVNKFSESKTSKVDRIVELGTLELSNTKIELIDLKGHAIDQIGIVTEDNVFFCGDTILSEELLKKHKLPLVVDIENCLKALEFIKHSQYEVYVPSHAAITEHIAPLAQKNIDVVMEICEAVMECCKTQKSKEEIVAYIIDKYHIYNTPAQYLLVNTSIAAYISYLFNEEKLTFEFVNNVLKYKEKE